MTAKRVPITGPVRIVEVCIDEKKRKKEDSVSHFYFKTRLAVYKSDTDEEIKKIAMMEFNKEYSILKRDVDLPVSEFEATCISDITPKYMGVQSNEWWN